MEQLEGEEEMLRPAAQLYSHEREGRQGQGF